MKNKKILILAFVVSLLVASSCGTASAFEGRDDLGMPGSSGSSSGGGADHKLVWTHYSFNSETGLKDQAIWLVPQYITETSGNGWAGPYKTQNDYDYAKRVVISGECAQPDVGFWALTLSTSESMTVGDGYYDDKLSASANSTYRNETQTTYLTSSPLLPAFPDSQGTYISGNSYVIYRNAGKNGYSPYHTVSFNNNTGISYQNDNKAIYNNPQTLYYYDGREMHAMYTSDMIASSENDIYDSYATFYRKQYGETISKEEAPEKMAGNDGKGTYAFCSFDSKNVENTINSKTSISIDGTKTGASSDWNKSTTNNNVYITNNNKIKLTTKFVYSRNNNDDTTVVASFNRTESPAGASVPSGTGSIGIGIMDIDSQYVGKEYEITEANKEITICSSTSHSHLIEINSEGFTETNTASSKACIKVKYVPDVAAIDSKTTLAVNGLSKKESGPDENDELNLGRVPYGARAITAIWSYNLSSSSRCIESNFNGTSCSGNNSSITSDFKVNYKRSGLVYNDSNYDDQFVTLRNSKYSSSVGSNTKTYNLLPGEQLTQKQGISHYSGVHTDGTPAEGAKEESSSVTLNATASDVICGLNNQPFGLGNAVNYGRMTVVKNSTLPYYVYGDNLVDGNSTWSDSGDIWLRPTDTVQLSYEGCIGEQIAMDKDIADWNAQITEDYKNSIMGVKTTEDLLDDPHYTGTGNSIDKDDINSKNITAHEVLGSTINKHIDAKYQFGAQITKPAQVGNVGRIIDNDYEIRSDGSRNVRATMKIPYNYILEPEISAGTKEIVTLGNENSFTISVKNADVRTNVKVQNDAYQTDVKPGTKAAYLKFVAKTDTSASVLASLNGQFISGDKTGDIVSTLSGIDFKNPSSGNIAIPSSGKVDEETVKVSADESDSEYNKLCVAVAVYPADSHNLGGTTKIENEDQSAALSDSINGGYTRIAVACKTVGKYPTISVEGNGIVAGGNVTGAYTEYNNRYFGSWTEYSLIANSVKNFASGASLAYTNPQTTINATAAWNLGGLNKEYFDSPQTLGNMSDDVGLQDEAEASLRVSQMQSFADDVKSTFFTGTPDGSGIIESPNDNKTFINANFDDDVEIGTELANDINTKANKGMVLIYSEGNIEISNEVQYLNAVLIADGKVDTCSEANQGGDNGQLLDSCYNPLVINGVVFSNKDIALDRVYGGGSTDGMNLDSNTLIQRAEIFNFNPEIVEWGYNYKHKTQPITTTYIEELSTRY